MGGYNNLVQLAAELCSVQFYIRCNAGSGNVIICAGNKCLGLNDTGQKRLRQIHQ